MNTGRTRIKACEPPPVRGARWVPLTRGRFALVDEADFAAVAQRPWCVDGAGYVNSRQGRLHRFLMPNAPSIDHINGNRLDNRRSNLRSASYAENLRNRRLPSTSKSGYKGVSPVKNGRWRATIVVNYKQHWLGSFDTAEDAARAYDAAALRLHGEFASPNAPGVG